MKTSQISKPAAWHSRARQKFYTLSAEADGLRAALGASFERMAQLRRDLNAVQRDREPLAKAIAWNDPLPHREADRARSVDRLAGYAAEIERLRAVEGELLKNHENIVARSDRINRLIGRCGRLLVELRLLNREEVSL